MSMYVNIPCLKHEPVIVTTTATGNFKPRIDKICRNCGTPLDKPLSDLKPQTPRR